MNMIHIIRLTVYLSLLYYPLLMDNSYGRSYIDTSRNYEDSLRNRRLNSDVIEQGEIEVPKAAQIEVMGDFPNEHIEEAIPETVPQNKNSNKEYTKRYRGAFDTYADRKEEFTLFMQNQRLQSQVILESYQTKLSILQFQTRCLIGYSFVMSIALLFVVLYLLKKSYGDEVAKQSANIIKKDFLS